MFPSRLTLAVVAALLSGASAGLQVIVPGGDSLWWVDQSDNNLIWNCNESGVTAFNVLLYNPNINLLPSALPIVGNLNNYVCMKDISKDLFSLTAGTGYVIQLTDILNDTNIYTQSQPFELKALGSPYPDASATPTGSGSGSSSTGSSSGTSSGSTPSGSTTGQTGGSIKATICGLTALAAFAVALLV